MKGDHPIAWCQNYQGGRAFYTGGGHTKESYAEPGLPAAPARRHPRTPPARPRPTAGRRPATGRSSTAQTLDGWKQAGPGAFTVDDGTLRLRGRHGHALVPGQGAGVVLPQARLEDARGDDNSGVFVGFPASDDPWSAVNNGYEIQIDATDAAGPHHGRRLRLPVRRHQEARDRALRPPGQWNTYEIRVQGERLRVWLNGVKINDFTNTDPARSLTRRLHRHPEPRRRRPGGVPQHPAQGTARPGAPARPSGRRATERWPAAGLQTSADGIACPSRVPRVRTGARPHVTDCPSVRSVSRTARTGVWLIGARGSVATTVVAGCAAVTAGLHPPDRHGHRDPALHRHRPARPLRPGLRRPRHPRLPAAQTRRGPRRRRRPPARPRRGRHTPNSPPPTGRSGPAAPARRHPHRRRTHHRLRRRHTGLLPRPRPRPGRRRQRRLHGTRVGRNRPGRRTGSRPAPSTRRPPCARAAPTSTSPPPPACTTPSSRRPQRPADCRTRAATARPGRPCCAPSSPRCSPSGRSPSGPGPAPTSSAAATARPSPTRPPRPPRTPARNGSWPTPSATVPEGDLHIDDVPALGDWKTAWDHIAFDGFLGTRMILQTTWQGCDSALAAPLVLDLARLLARAHERGLSGPLTRPGLLLQGPGRRPRRRSPTSTPRSSSTPDCCGPGRRHEPGERAGPITGGKGRDGWAEAWVCS